jgi:hypothetical protein
MKHYKRHPGNWKRMQEVGTLKYCNDHKIGKEVKYLVKCS